MLRGGSLIACTVAGWHSNVHRPNSFSPTLILWTRQKRVAWMMPPRNYMGKHPWRCLLPRHESSCKNKKVCVDAKYVFCSRIGLFSLKRPTDSNRLRPPHAIDAPTVALFQVYQRPSEQSLSETPTCASPSEYRRKSSPLQIDRLDYVFFHLSNSTQFTIHLLLTIQR
jgi:hypothetical protein